jgi:threonine synthase
MVTLGEGNTPLLKLERLGAQTGLGNLYLKDEGENPTGSFKARGLAVAVSKAKELGLTRGAIPSAGNAGGAFAAYAAKAGLTAHIFMPADVPAVFRSECSLYGATLHLVDGVITDCAQALRERAEQEGWFDFSTLREPYRLEGKKTMGYELAEQGGGQLPEVVIYPTGGGTGLVGMWKAFAELRQLGWLEGDLPRMVAVQAAGCAPIVQAFAAGAEQAHPWQGAETVALGLRVPQALGDFLILRVLRESRGTAVAVDDSNIIAALRELAAVEGVWACPEGAATWAACKKLVASGWIKPQERVVLFNTGTGLKYLEVVNPVPSRGRQRLRQPPRKKY